MNGNRNFYELFPITSYLLLLILAFFGLEYIAQTKLDGEGGGLTHEIHQKLL